MAASPTVLPRWGDLEGTESIEVSQTRGIPEQQQTEIYIVLSGCKGTPGVYRSGPLITSANFLWYGPGRCPRRGHYRPEGLQPRHGAAAGSSRIQRGVVSRSEACRGRRTAPPNTHTHTPFKSIDGVLVRRRALA